jgi:hypothetical protein
LWQRREFCRLAAARGAQISGIDAAEGMTSGRTDESTTGCAIRPTRRP